MTSRPRITFSRSPDGFLEVWMNPAGRDLLVEQLRGLSEHCDHVHIMPEDTNPEVPARSQAYTPGDEVMEWGKILFRPDEWDEKYFPHVLSDPDTKVL